MRIGKPLLTKSTKTRRRHLFLLKEEAILSGGMLEAKHIHFSVYFYFIFFGKVGEEGHQKPRPRVVFKG